jgi:hypothetical protein
MPTPEQVILSHIDRALRSRIRGPLAIAIEQNGTSYYLWQQLSPGQWLRVTLTPRMNTNGGAVQEIYEYVLVTPAALVAAVPTGGGIVESGTFTTSASYRYSTTAGNTMTYTSPAGTTRLGVQAGKFTNGGLSVVAIDSDRARARLLPTAGELVERGLYPASILTINGGTLALTDRCIDHYGAGRLENVLVADDLTPAAHAVVIATTGYQRTASTGARTYVAGVLHAQAQTLGSAGVTNHTLFQFDGGPGASATEYAISARPSGGSFQFMGTVHDNESQQSLTVLVDGVAPTFTSGVPIFPQSSTTITKESTLLHPTAGACATVKTIYALDRDGFTIDVTVDWSQAMQVNAAYAMLPLNGATQTVGSIPRPNFDRGDLLDNGSGPMRFSGDPANPFRGISKSAAAWMWTSALRFVAALYIEDILAFTDDWQPAAGNIYANIQDRSGVITKAYISRVGAVASAIYESVTSDTTWHWTAHYMFASMDSPDRVFAG